MGRDEIDLFIFFSPLKIICSPFPKSGSLPLTSNSLSLPLSLSLSHGRAGQLDGGARQRTRAAPAVARSGARRSRARTGEPRPARPRLGGRPGRD